MKKTLITLAALALASVAQAASANSLPLTIPTGGNFYAGSYTFDFIIGEVVADMITAESPMLIAAYWGGAKDSSGSIPTTYYANAFVLSKNSDGDILLTVGRGAFAATTDLGDAGWEPDLTSTWTFASGENDKRTFSMTLQTDTWYTITNIGDDQGGDQNGDGLQGQVVTLAEAGGLTETANWYSGNMNGGSGSTEMKTYLNPLVPEPTTATLSLLALAGLAARRRRK